MGLRKVVKKFIPEGVFRKIEPFGHLAEAVVLNTPHDQCASARADEAAQAHAG